MFGRSKRQVKIPVPGTPVVIIDEASHVKDVEAALQQNAELDELNIDKTVADSFPASDPASSVPQTTESPAKRKVA